METTSELESLLEKINRFRIVITPTGKYLSQYDDYKEVTFRIFNNKYTLYIYDEYNDLSTENPPMSLLLVLWELESYVENDDYLTWCDDCMFDPADMTVRNYHMGLRTVYPEIKQLMNDNVEPDVSSFDFHFGAGATSQVRAYKANKS